ncbi:MAG TPA: YdeI/OmpD-associated family protein [Candidatus Acidoferrales bacterium]|nr:YdeI/OmpD-associated family protein [Candidatus Acidoferrales bacterium]
MAKPRFFTSGEEFRAWLEERHASEGELLLGFYKKELARGISYAEALDAALAFGWIDGVRKRLSAEAYAIRFTPRKARSIWSAVNTKRAKELEAAGLMAAPGLRAFRERDEKRAKLYSYERAAAKLDARLEAVLRENREAATFFDAQPPGYKRLAIFWVMSAKKEETRERRLSVLIASSAKGKRIDMLKPKRK